jgi:FkbM family methyltransferase
MFLSYAQRLEDYHLMLAFAGEPPGRYVDVGGGHPVADNVTYALYLSGWRGVVVEPQRRLAEATRATRPGDIVVEAVLGREEGEAQFHAVAGLHGFSTAVAARAAELEAQGGTIATARLPMTTLGAVVRTAGLTRIDILKIDVEGAEADVLAGHDWRVRPRVLVIEAVAPGSMTPAWDTFEPDLLARGYDMRLYDGLNRFYVAAEEPALAARLPAEPAPWDAVAHLWDHGRAHERAGHPDHAIAIALVRGALARAPSLDPALLAELLRDGGFDGAVDLETLRPALARIASGYDGGHLFED